MLHGRRTDAFTLRGSVISVPMARGQHLFPCRTQKLSLVAVTILGVHPWENSTVPNYIKAIRIGWLLSFAGSLIGYRYEKASSRKLIIVGVVFNNEGQVLLLPGGKSHFEDHKINDIRWILPEKIAELSLLPGALEFVKAMNSRQA